jgi:MFS family permease
MATEVNEPTTPEEHVARLARALKTLDELDTTLLGAQPTRGGAAMSATEVKPSLVTRSLGALATLRAEPAYARLLLGGFISGIGDWFNTVAILGLLLQLTGSPLAISVSLAIRWAPRVLLAPLTGALADRAPRKVIVVTCDILSTMAALSFLLVTDASRVWIIWVGLAALVVLSAFRGPASVGIIPAVVRPESLAGANALEGVSIGSMTILGAALGGVAATWFGPGPSFIINAASFALSAILTISVAIPRTLASETRGLAALREPLSLIRHSPALRLVFALSFIVPLGAGASQTLTPIYGARVFHAGDQGIGTLYAAIGVGYLLGGLVAPRFAARPALTMVASLFVCGMMDVALSQSPTLVIAALAQGLFGVTLAVMNTYIGTLVMREAPPDVLGRIAAVQDVINLSIIIPAALVAGALIEVVNPRMIGALAGAIIALVGLLAFLPARRIKELGRRSGQGVA